MSLNNLGLCYRHKGEPQKALKMHEQAVYIFEQVEYRSARFGIQSLSYFDSLSTLITFFVRVNFLSRGHFHFRGWQALGKDHPNTAAAVKNLIAVLEALGKFEEARPLYERRLGEN